MSDEQGDVQSRWTAKKRMALVVSIVRGDTSVQEAARAHGLTVAEIDSEGGGVADRGARRRCAPVGGG